MTCPRFRRGGYAAGRQYRESGRGCLLEAVSVPQGAPAGLARGCHPARRAIPRSLTEAAWLRWATAWLGESDVRRHALFYELISRHTFKIARRWPSLFRNDG